MKHSHWQEVNGVNRQRSDYNRFSDLGKSENGKILALMLLIFSLTGTAFSAERYRVRRPVSPPVPLATKSEEVSETTKPSDAPQNEEPPQCTVYWETDYESAVESARNSRRNLLIYFEAKDDSPEFLETTKESYVQQGKEKIRQLADVPKEQQVPVPIASSCEEFNKKIIGDVSLQSDLGKYVLLKLPMDAVRKDVDELETVIYQSPEFADMANYPGLVLVEYENPDASYYEQVVAILPFWRGKAPGVKETAAFLNLPAGTLTQRTMIYAVRIHKDKPLSSDGEPNPVTADIASEQALYQAEKNVMGHQNYGERSQRALRILGGGSPSEICAQSWSGESLFEAAIGCMRAWRSSSAHWNIGKRSHTYYGYDIRRGRGGAWFATGFFVD